MDFKSIVVIIDTNIKNNNASLIWHDHSNLNSITKTIYHTVNVTTTEAELFAIRCGINQAIQIPNTSHIIVIINAIYSVRQIFDTSIHPYQLQLIIIAQDLREFFNKMLRTQLDFGIVQVILNRFIIAK